MAISKLPNIGYDRCAFLDYDSWNDLTLYEIGSYMCPPLYSYGPLIRPRAIFHYVMKGHGKLIIQDKEYEIGPNEGFLIPAYCKAYYIADKTDPWAYCWMHIGGLRSKELLQQAGLSKHNPVYRPLKKDDSIPTIFEDLFHHQEEELYCIGKLYEILSILQKNSRSQIAYVPEDPKLDYVKKTIRYIQLKYSESIHIDEIAMQCGLNRSYLARLFKEATGTTIQNYLITYRMKIAVKMMEDSSFNLQYISFAVGYGDLFTFSKAFKRIYGISPSEYRKQNSTDIALSH